MGENPETLWNSPKSASGYLKSKFLGDMAVMEEFPDATIIRPSEMIGTQDWFTWYYRGMARRGNKWAMPLWKKGHYTVKAPVSYTNVTDAIQIARARFTKQLDPNVTLCTTLLSSWARLWI